MGQTELLEKYFDRLWPLCRSITGSGLRQSLKILQELLPLELAEVPSGTKVFDWTVPDEWNIEDAYVADESGKRIIDFKSNNLHLLSYSEPVDQWMDLEALEKHLYSLPAQPTVIPYLTSYYKRRWGFCLTHEQRRKLKPGKYRAVVKSTLAPGSMTYGHCVLPATVKTQDEVLITTYVCHPSMANNELSGPLVASFLYGELKALPMRRYNYRFIMAPETIGAITYLATHGDHLKAHCKAGLVVTCCGDDGNITYKRSRQGGAEIDRCAESILTHYGKRNGKKVTFLDFFPSGSDERQYCSQGFNLPVGSLMRSMYATFPEYHTSADDKSFISFEALGESVSLYKQTLMALESNRKFQATITHCEPMLGPRGLYPTLGSEKQTEERVRLMMYLLNYSDGVHDLCAIAEKASCSVLDLAPVVVTLLEGGLLRAVETTGAP
jgi:aminopeptidase-like protein